MSACGARIAHELTPKIRAERPMTHSEAGGLSTVIEFAASDEPKNNAFQLVRAGLHRRGVEAVRPARRRQSVEVERAGREQER